MKMKFEQILTLTKKSKQCTKQTIQFLAALQNDVYLGKQMVATGVLKEPHNGTDNLAFWQGTTSILVCVIHCGSFGELGHLETQ